MVQRKFAETLHETKEVCNDGYGAKEVSSLEQRKFFAHERIHTIYADA